MRLKIVVILFMLTILIINIGSYNNDEISPFGIASGSEWSHEYPKFLPMLGDAGVQWLRYFPEWQTIQPKEGVWNWEIADDIVIKAKENHIKISGLFAYFAPWASANGGTRCGPIKDIRFWREYVAACMERYKDDIHYWEIWNEFNGSFYEGRNREERAHDYAELVRVAYEEGKKISPQIKIGMSCANFDPGFFDAAIKAGAAGHFHFLAVHPYENLAAAMEGGEYAYLNMATNLREMLKANGQNAEIPLFITETGIQSTVTPDEKNDILQVEAMVKVYVLSLAQGFSRVDWFEVRGPAYGKNTDHGIIRHDWTLRPAYHALKNMITILGKKPKYLGWLLIDKNGSGFVFDNGKEKILVAWSPVGSNNRISFAKPVKIANALDKFIELPERKELSLSKMPVFIRELPEELVAKAVSQKNLPFPWGRDYRNAKSVSCRLGSSNISDGIQQVREETTAVVHGLTESWRRTNFAHGSEGRYIYFRVDPTFAHFGTNKLEITVISSRSVPKMTANFSILYESLSGYITAPGGVFDIPEGEQWYEHTWKVDDANFVGGWGWNFRIEATGSPSEVNVKEVRVKKLN